MATQADDHGCERGVGGTRPEEVHVLGADERLQIRDECRACEGSGTSRASSHYQCVACDAHIPFLEYVAGTYGLPCGHDYDRGYLVRRDCEACDGKGYHLRWVSVGAFVARVIESLQREERARFRYQRDRYQTQQGEGKESV